MTDCRVPLAALAALAAALAGCQSQGPTKEEIEIARQTVDCDHGGERFLIRFVEGEARILTPDANRIILYQVPTNVGVHYTNGVFDLRGRGLQLELSRDRQTVRMICKPYELPPPKKDG